MMGRQTSGQNKLFYSFNLDDHVPHDHLLRGINRCLDLSRLHQHLAEHYSHTGRPSFDPAILCLRFAQVFGINQYAEHFDRYER